MLRDVAVLALEGSHAFELGVFCEVFGIDRGARVLSICTGAFVLGQAGLLDGRRCTTHWQYTDELARRYPYARVEADVLYVDEDPVITGAGTAAGIDTCLHLVRKEHGSAAANMIARRMVAPPHREGGQGQYRKLPTPRTPDGTLAPVLAWMLDNLHQSLTVADMAARAAMSPRTFARRFRTETGTTPLRWLTTQRLLTAQHLLETSTEPIATIANRTGFGSIDTFRHHFTHTTGITPHAYRSAFRAPAPAITRHM
ncbi:helix-turn-helix domain-containing protein [Streptomyces sp. NPDC017936]|uniref:helix-turn-helix domain-containing protein n=1 Tax=Streptomyces sp. NPDC017936 TaxID=3365016 RepID=UPI0037AC07A1